MADIEVVINQLVLKLDDLAKVKLYLELEVISKTGPMTCSVSFSSMMAISATPLTSHKLKIGSLLMQEEFSAKLTPSSKGSTYIPLPPPSSLVNPIIKSQKSTAHLSLVMGGSQKDTGERKETTE